MSDGRATNGGLRSPRGGRPRWEPTDEARTKVFELAGRGIPQEHIALFIGVSESTLKRRCREELRLGAMKANAAVAMTAYQMGISDEHPEMTRFWLRCCAGWRDRCDIPLGGMEVRFKLIEGDDW